MSKNFKVLLQAVRDNNLYSAWFKTQSVEEHSKGLIEEVEEVKQAIKNNDIDNLEEELGDVLWDAMCLISIAERDYNLDFEKIVKRVNQKFMKRKPHIFEKRIVSLEKEKEVWYKEKSKEKGRIKNE